MFWAPGFWSPGFWASGFWQEVGQVGERRLLPPIAEWLAQSTDVTDLVGYPPRVWRHKRVPRTKQLPYVSWQLIAGVPENELSDSPPMDRITVQVDCWDPGDLAVETLALAVRTELERRGHCTGVVIDERDPETDNYRMGMQFDIFLTRAPMLP